MPSSECPRCRGLSHPADTLLAMLVWEPERVTSSPLLMVACATFLRGREYALAQWLIRDTKAGGAPDMEQRIRLAQEAPKLLALFDRVSAIALEVVEETPGDALLNALHAATAFPGLPETPRRKRKPKPRAWERTLRLVDPEPQDPAA